MRKAPSKFAGARRQYQPLGFIKAMLASPPVFTRGSTRIRLGWLVVARSVVAGPAPEILTAVVKVV
jgi:hypothetical protein